MSGKQRHIRKRRALDEQEELPDGPEGGEEEAPRLTAEDIRLMQKQRQRRTVRCGAVGEAWRCDAGDARHACVRRSRRSIAACPLTRASPRCRPLAARKQGVEASTLGMAHLRADKKAAAAAGEERDAGGGGGLQAAFKRERRLFSEEDDPHM